MLPRRVKPNELLLRYGSGVMSIISVPATVPSLLHISYPLAGVSWNRKKRVSPMAFKSEGICEVEFVTIIVPASVPSLLHRFQSLLVPSGPMARKKSRPPTAVRCCG